jgi:hypothetical protein
VNIRVLPDIDDAGCCIGCGVTPDQRTGDCPCCHATPDRLPASVTDPTRAALDDGIDIPCRCGRLGCPECDADLDAARLEGQSQMDEALRLHSEGPHHHYTPDDCVAAARADIDVERLVVALEAVRLPMAADYLRAHPESHPRLVAAYREADR